VYGEGASARWGWRRVTRVHCAQRECIFLCFAVHPRVGLDPNMGGIGRCLSCVSQQTWGVMTQNTGHTCLISACEQSCGPVDGRRGGPLSTRNDSQAIPDVVNVSEGAICCRWGDYGIGELGVVVGEMDFVGCICPTSKAVPGRIG
jgi:hypothetical protein